MDRNPSCWCESCNSFHPDTTPHTQTPSPQIPAPKYYPSLSPECDGIARQIADTVCGWVDSEAYAKTRGEVSMYPAWFLQQLRELAVMYRAAIPTTVYGGK